MLHLPHTRAWFTATTLLLALAGCGDSTTPMATVSPTDTATTAIATASTTAEPTETASADSATDSAASPTPSDEASSSPTSGASVSSSLAPGQYCYSTKTKTLDAAIRLTVAGKGQITGDSAATIQDAAQGYNSSYRQKITGKLDGDQLAADTTTWIEYDVQKKTETWTVTQDQIKSDRDTFAKADCAKVKAKFADDKGTEAKDLTESATAVHRKAVKFDVGTSSTVLSNAVVRGDRDVYTLDAAGGQMMILSVSATENNAVFDLIGPGNVIIATEQTDFKLPLPSTGEYQIIVGGTRGNASYKLNLEIR
jgi:hypothetical protein